MPAFAAAVLLFLPFTAATAAVGDADAELQALVTQIQTDIRPGKRTEAALADDCRQFDALLAEHRGKRRTLWPGSFT